MKSYTYRTDGELGTIEAESFADACQQLDAMHAWGPALLNGGWGWVDDCDGVEPRYEIGPLQGDQDEATTELVVSPTGIEQIVAHVKAFQQTQPVTAADWRECVAAYVEDAEHDGQGVIEIPAWASVTGRPEWRMVDMMELAVAE